MKLKNLQKLRHNSQEKQTHMMQVIYNDSLNLDL